MKNLEYLVYKAKCSFMTSGFQDVELSVKNAMDAEAEQDAQ